MKLRPGSLAARLIGASLLWIVLALGAAAFGLSSLYREHVVREHAERAGGYLDELIAALDVAADGTLILQRELSDPLFRRPYSGLYWEAMRDGEVLHRSRSLWDRSLEPPLPGAPEAPVSQAGPEGQHLTVWTRIVRYPGLAQPVTVRVAADGARVEQMAASFTRTLVISLALLALGLAGLVLAQVRFGLAPLRRLGRAMNQLRAGEVERVEGVYPLEIRPLVEDLNVVLHENRELLTRARAQAGNLAHALKTPLAVIRNALPDLGAPGAEVVGAELQRMHAAIERHLVRARAGATSVHGRHVPVRAALEDVVRVIRRIHGPLQIALEGDTQARFRGDAADLQEIFGNLLDNAAKWARSQVRVTIETRHGQIRIVVEDDGPGIAPERRADAIRRGVRLDNSRPGSGLGLQIVDELCRVYGGSLELGDAAMGGLAAIVLLPAR